MRAFGLSVPANLLLLGEYAVLEEGGLGLAMATLPRARIRVEAAPGFSIRGILGGKAFRWTLDGEEAPSPLLEACLAEAQGRLSLAGLPTRFEGLGVDIDSSDFFASDGSKRGLGSSAAVAVGLVAALLRAGGLDAAALDQALFPAALAAHRRSQGGRGSGYDVAASRFGGLGLFTGGREPGWKALGELGLPALWLWRGTAPVSSAAAVARYEAWRSERPEAASAFLAASRASLTAFLEAERPADRLEALREAARLGIGLGEALGVPATLAPPPRALVAATAALAPRPRGRVAGGEWAFKALGAGNELGLLASTLVTCPGPAYESVIPEGEGLLWD